jgi:hypothetical protein
MRDLLTAACLLAAGTSLLAAQPSAMTGSDDRRSRGGVSAGMGVTYMNPADIVELVNATPGAVERISQFRSGVEFFGCFSLPLHPEWVLKLEYAYQLGSCNINTTGDPAQYGITVHAPTAILQYVLTERGVYNVRVGVGGGYWFGSVSEKYVYIDDRYDGAGPGFVLDLEGNTAFGDNFYAYLGGTARWQFIGELADANGRSPGNVAVGSATTLHAFGVGARLGFTYYLF